MPSPTETGKRDVRAARRSYSTNWLTPTSFGVWGGSPGERARLALTLATRIDSTPLWLQVEKGAGGKEPSEYAVINRLRPDDFYLVNPADLAPPDELANAATWFLRDGIDPGERLSRLADVVRLPLLVQRLLGGRSVYSSTKALVMANSDRLQPMYPTGEGGIRPFIDAFNEFATTVVFTITTPPQPNAHDVDYVFYLESVEEDGRKTTRATTQYGAPAGVPGLFPTGAGWSLDELLATIGTK